VAALKARQTRARSGAALQTADAVARGLAGTRNFVSELYAAVKEGVVAGCDLKPSTGMSASDCGRNTATGDLRSLLPFDVSRAYDEATRFPRPAHLDGGA